MSHYSVKGIEQLALLLLDSIGEHIAVMDLTGEIVFVNQPWIDFSDENSSGMCHPSWIGINYLDACEHAAISGDQYGKVAVQGIREVIESKRKYFYQEYPCHSPSEARWFIMRVRPIEFSETRLVLVSHQDITQRKIAEEQVRAAATLDGLTGVKNRQTGEKFLQAEFSRCQRLSLPLSIAMIDVDDFKSINDKHGHLIGDRCLQLVSRVMSKYCQRPGDCCYRFGGDEFVLVWGGMEWERAHEICSRIITDIRSSEADTNIEKSVQILVSLGLVTHTPKLADELNVLINLADKALYKAKNEGKNGIACAAEGSYFNSLAPHSSSASSEMPRHAPETINPIKP